MEADRFILYVDDAPNKDDYHTTETVNWLVLEAGNSLVPTLSVGTPGRRFAHSP